MFVWGGNWVSDGDIVCAMFDWGGNCNGCGDDGIDGGAKICTIFLGGAGATTDATDAVDAADAEDETDIVSSSSSDAAEDSEVSEEYGGLIKHCFLYSTSSL